MTTNEANYVHGADVLMALRQGDVALLRSEVAQPLMVSRELVRLAYVAGGRHTAGVPDALLTGPGWRS